MPFAFDADPRYGKFGLRTECPRCGAHLPVNGPAAEVDCAGCGERVNVPREVLTSMLDAFEEGWPDAAHADTASVRDLTWRWTSDPVDGALCPSCEARLDDSGTADLLPCGGCGAQISSVEPPAELRRVTGISRVIGGALDLTRESQSTAPVVLACPACGAGLSITYEHQRITPCVHCGSQVHLPDAVWRQLHPPRTVRPWTVRFTGESRPARKRRRDEQAQEQSKIDKARRREQEAAGKAKREAQEAADRAEKEAADAAKAAETQRLTALYAETRARRARWTLPLTVLAGLGTLVALGVMFAATLSFVLGHNPVLFRYGSGTTAVRVVTDALVFAGAVAAVVAWLFAVLTAAVRSGKPVTGTLFWSCFMAGLSILPMIGPPIGLFWAWQHVTGSEPTPDTDKLPLGTGWPLAPLYVVGPLYAHLCYAALGDVTLGQFFKQLFS